MTDHDFDHDALLASRNLLKRQRDDYRAWGCGIVGNTPTNRAASDEDLRRAITQLLQRSVELVDGQPMAFTPTQEEADALGLDLAASYTATLTRRAYSVTAVLQITDATGAKVGVVKRSYRATSAEVSLKRPTFSGKQLRRRRLRLERRLAHLTERSASRPEGTAAYDVAEASAIQTALVLFDEALVAGGELPDEGALARADRTEHLEHLIDVLAELAAAGDVDGIRMHYEHHKGVSRG